MGSHHKDNSKHKYIDTTYLTKCFTSATFFSLVSPWLPQLLAPSTMAMGFSAGQSTPHCGTQSTRISRPMSVSPSEWVPVCKTYTETECNTENKKVCEKTW